MRKLILYTIFIYCWSFSYSLSAQGRFDPENDILLVHYDCKTDVDDVHSAAALSMLLTDPAFENIRYHAVAGTYGIQEGLYVPPNALFEKAFGTNWSDAHADWPGAVKQVAGLAVKQFEGSGAVWVADAGQSDFTADVLREVIKALPGTDVKSRFHVVQHSNWNEEVTSPDALKFVKTYATYHKIPDGNATGNGTPGFRDPDIETWKSMLSDPEIIGLWQLAVDIGNEYNGKEGRYLNEAVASGGLDFSDMAEVCYILGLENIKDAEEFFSRFGK